MKVLILGGAGFIGTAIREELKKVGHVVTAFSRANGDRRKLADLEKVAGAGPWDVVIDNCGYTAADMDLFFKAFGKKAGRLIFTSTVSVYRFNKETFFQPLREDDIDYAIRPSNEDPNNVHWKYARGKLEAEAVIRKQKEVPWTIFRPSVVYGPRDSKDRIFWYLSRLVKGGPILLANDGAQSFRLTYSEDVARAYAKAIELTESKNQVYYLAQREIVTFKMLLEKSAEALKIPLETISVPLEMLGDLAGPMGGFGNFVPDITKVTKELDFAPTPFEKFAVSTAKWFRDHWIGDEQALLSSRDAELAFAQKWKTKVLPLFT